MYIEHFFLCPSSQHYFMLATEINIKTTNYNLKAENTKFHTMFTSRYHG